MKFRICFPILQSPIIILWFLLYVFSIMLGGCSCVLFLFIKEYHLYFLNFTFFIMELKSHSPSIFIYVFLNFSIRQLFELCLLSSSSTLVIPISSL
jgi:hypothetical protein